MSNWKKLALVSCATATLAGCQSLRQPLTDFATDYNRLIGDARNQMILLNIVRSRHREPTHYSALGTVTGSLSLTGRVEANVSGTIEDEMDLIPVSVTPSVSMTSAPTFTIIPLNSADFSRGILRPVSPSVIGNLLNQGWRTEPLAALFVENIRCGDLVYVNDPEHYGAVSVQFARDPDIRYLTGDQLADISFSMHPPEPPQSRDGGTEGVLIANVGAAEALETLTQSLRDDYQISVDDGPNNKEILFHFTPVESLVPHVALPDLEGCAETTGQHSSGEAVPGGPARHSLREGVQEGFVTLRSVDGVVFYLGETARDLPGGLRLSDGSILFRLRSSRPDSGWSVRVEHRHGIYYVASGEGERESRDRSIQVLSLISQLIALQTSDEALQRAPSTLTVR